MLQTRVLSSSFSLPAAYRLLKKRGNLPKKVNQSNGNFMANISAAWKQLSDGKKRQLIDAHQKGRSIPVKNEHQRYSNTHSTSDFNLIMRLLYSPDKFGGKCKDAMLSGSLAGLIAKKTVRLLSPNDQEKLRKHFRVATKREKWNKTMYDNEVIPQLPTATPITRHRSFREMFNKLYRDDPFTIFLAVATTGGQMRLTEQYRKAVQKKWETLSPQLRVPYRPISEAEASQFERHCAAASLERDSVQVPILDFFCEFRGIPRRHTSDANQSTSTTAADKKILERAKQLYRQDCRHAYIERVRSSISRATKNLESDALRDVATRSRVVPAEHYAKAFKGKNDVQLAKTIARERYGVTVFDEVVKRMKKGAN